MSFLDLDEWLIDLAAAVDIVFSPVMDIKQYPENVDVVLVDFSWLSSSIKASVSAFL
jgi:NAD-reducing hydrogenase small subunit